MTRNTLNPILWLIIPVALIIAQVVLELTVPAAALPSLHSEGGPHEILQEAFIISALLMAIYAMMKLDWRMQKDIGIVLIVIALGSFYIAGEEMSWGQHLLGWSTPEEWGTVNDQNETNLHNTSAWLDQKPRLLLFIGIVIGGLIVPALRRWNPSKLPAAFNRFYPSATLAVTACGVLLPYTIQEMGEHFLDYKAFTRVSEVQEAYMYYFILLYTIDLYKREILQSKNLK